jgi:hypothetical protein
MTATVDIVNRSLQVPGTRTTVTAAELLAGSSNEAIQANLVIDNIRRKLLRMAPWNFAMKSANLTYVTSSPGTPENATAATNLWQPGQPSPPWNYEYQYPVDCLRPCWIIPSTQTGFAGGIPITTAVTGGAASFWQGPPVKFKVQNDQFLPVTAAAIASAGTGYVVGEVITLAGTPSGSPPIGAPCQLTVTSVGGGGTVTGVSIINTVIGEAASLGGSYFGLQINPVAQGSSTGVGVGATFNLTQGPVASQRVILCNQEFAIGVYVQDITDPNIMDDAFQDAWVKVLGATLTIPLTGDKKLANLAIQEANQIVMQARTMDGNEGFTVNDITPDWIRIRGVDFAEPYAGPYTGFDWGGLYPIFG